MNGNLIGVGTFLSLVLAASASELEKVTLNLRGSSWLSY